MMTPEERQELVLEFTKALACNVNPHQLSDEELQWVRLAIAAEARKIKFRDAVIEKTLVGLAWLLILGIGSMFYEWAQAHGYKP